MFDWHLHVFGRFIWKPIDPVVPPSCTVSPSSIAGSTLRVERRCKSSWCNMKNIEQRDWRCEIDSGFCRRQGQSFDSRPGASASKSSSNAWSEPRTLYVLVIFLLSVEDNLQQVHDLLAPAFIKSFSRASSSRYFSSIPNSSIRFTRNKSWKMTKRTLSYQLSGCGVRAAHFNPNPQKLASSEQHKNWNEVILKKSQRISGIWSSNAPQTQWLRQRHRLSRPQWNCGICLLGRQSLSHEIFVAMKLTFQ